MSKVKNPKKTHINIKFPDGNTLQFDIQEELTQISCLTAIKNQPLVFWYTNGEFITKSGQHLRDADLSKEINQKSTLELIFKEKEYNFNTALNHIQQTARIIFFLTSHPEVTDCCQSVVSWITRTYENSSGRKVPTEQDYEEYYPENFQKSNSPKLVKYFDLLEDTKPSKEGIFIKTKVITKEKKEYIIDTTKDGFSIENSEKTVYYSTLYHLFSTISEFFKENSQFIVARWMSLDKIEKSSYLPINRQQVYFDNRKNKIKPQLRLFNVNKEILTGSVEDAINKINTDNQFNMICINIEEQYVNQISDSVKKIASGKITPENDGNNNIYIDNGVQITRIRDINEYKLLQNYLKSIDYLKNISPYIKVERPVIIDYLGQIYVTKSNKDEADFISQVTSEIPSTDTMNINFAKIFCDNFSCKSLPSTIRGFHREMAFAGGCAKNCVILTYVPTTTPRDANFADDEKCYLRPEILRSYEAHLELERHSKELVELGADPDFDYSHNPSDKAFTEEQKQALNKRRNEIIDGTHSLMYDLNLTNAEVKTDADLNAIGKFVKSYVICNFVNLFMTTVNCPMDGSYFVQKMHTYGLNVRYLGQLLEFLQVGKENEHPMNRTFSMAIQSEMIIRSYKHLVREKGLPVESILEDINTILHFKKDDKFEPLFETICEISMKKFGVRPNNPSIEQIEYLRRGLLAAFGIVVGIRKGSKPEDPIGLDDVTEVIPHVKFVFTKNNEYSNAMKSATRAFNNNDIASAYKQFQAAIHLSKQSVPQMDASLIDCFFYCAVIFYRSKQLDMAYQMMMKAAIMQERSTELTDTSLVSKYNMLASIANSMGNRRLAFVLYARACVLLKRIAPADPWIIDISADAATAASAFDADTALRFANMSIDACRETMPAGQVDAALSTCYATAASVAVTCEKLPLAAKFAEEAVRKNPGSEEYRRLRDDIETMKQRQATKRGGARGRRRGGH